MYTICQDLVGIDRVYVKLYQYIFLNSEYFNGKLDIEPAF